MSRLSQSRLFANAGALFAVLTALLFVNATPASAQGKATGNFMAQAVVRVTDNADKINKGRVNAGLGTYGYNEGISILGGWVNPNSSLSLTTDLKANVNYLFLADGDFDAADVDLEILDANGFAVASDLRANREAEVYFTPQVNGKYTLRMTLARSMNNVPCVCAAVILNENGKSWKVPVKNLDDATDNVVKALDNGDKAAQRLGHRLDLRRADNQWAFFGGVLTQGTNFGVSKLSLGNGSGLAVGAGDKFSRVINVDLENDQNQAIKQDLKQNAVSVIDFAVNGFGQHGLRVHNIRSNGPSVVLMAVMDIR